LPAWPAKVVTVPSSATRAMRWSDWSATRRLPLAGSTATPIGHAKRTLEPTPSAARAQLGVPPDMSGLGWPAMVATSPAGDTETTRKLDWSATKTVPSAATATPWLDASAAFVPTPSRAHEG